ncbi:MAG: hypothetical protein ABI353_09285 [Isosphaeraceae bacterium]
MGFSRNHSVGRVLALIAISAVVSVAVTSQSATAQVTHGGALFPKVMPQGEWAQVLSVTPKWMVIQNGRGQQFPVSLTQGNVRMFVIRWPIAPALISPRAVAEVTGVDLVSNTVQANHLDVFEPDAQGLLNGVWPSITHIGGLNRILSPYGADRDSAINGYATVYPLAIERNIPNRTHAVAPVFAVNPIRLALGNNNVLTVMPAGTGLNLTRVTAGSPTFVRPGDLAYVMISGQTPKTLALSELVVYKRMSFDQFAP